MIEVIRMLTGEARQRSDFAEAEVIDNLVDDHDVLEIAQSAQEILEIGIRGIVFAIDVEEVGIVDEGISFLREVDRGVLGTLAKIGLKL